ncbi:hypothetical protein Salat_0184900 [Sesamum alatum]|uniref:Uncharacterized protein n=1 Tax=Sesamum alatum TaxID=300844 RepID=A0AAE1YY98_9LAMI|nr:hypothetical protein Salat_0184900 [Sesamum alatum]
MSVRLDAGDPLRRSFPVKFEHRSPWHGALRTSGLFGVIRVSLAFITSSSFHGSSVESVLVVPSCVRQTVVGREVERTRRDLKLTEEEEGGLVIAAGLWENESYGDRALEGCPWIFYRNIIILNAINSYENLLQVDLDWFNFYVHIHDLLLSKMHLGIATHIGNRVGKFYDMDMDEPGCSGATFVCENRSMLIVPSGVH